ncbi:MAG: TetR/AcrR family transcriptional regulator [bacterium]
MKSKQRREQILEAATSVFAAKGYYRASITDIIKESGIARGTFYLYFESKREVFAELVDILLVRLTGAMTRIELSADSPPWQEQLLHNTTRIATILLEDKELTMILYNHALGLDEEFDKKIQEFYQTINRRTEGAIQLGQDMGLVRKDIRPWLAARHIVGSVKEVMFRLSQEEDEEIPVKKLAEELLSYSIHGLLEKPAPAGKGKRGKKG